MEKENLENSLYMENTSFWGDEMRAGNANYLRGYKEKAVTITQQLKDNSFNDTDVVIAFEVPEHSVDFTTYTIEETVEKTEKTTTYVMSGREKENVNGKEMLDVIIGNFENYFVRKLTELSKIFGKNPFNAIGYLQCKEFDKNYTGEPKMMVYDFFVNDNWLDYFFTEKIISNFGFNSLPLLYKGKFDYNKLLAIFNSPRYKQTNTSFIIKNIYEDLSSSYVRKSAYIYSPKSLLVELPAVKEIEIKPQDISQTKDIISSNTIPVITVNQTTELNDAEKKKYNTIKGSFFYYFGEREKTKERLKKELKVPLKKGNYFIIFNYLKGIFINEGCRDVYFLRLIRNDSASFNKITGKVVKEFLDEILE